jgi:uncharacterized protein YneF (UPF0154 family)
VSVSDFLYGIVTGFVSMLVFCMVLGFFITRWFKKNPQVAVQKGMRYMMKKNRDKRTVDA